MTPELSIVIPAYDEAARLHGPLTRIFEYLKDENLNAEVIVVDDGSIDGTARTAETEFARNPGIAAHVVKYDQNRGKGYAVRTGLKAAAGEIALISDADLSTPIEEMPKIVDPILRG